MLSTIFNLSGSDKRYLADIHQANVAANTALGVEKQRGLNELAKMRRATELTDPQGFRHSTDPKDRANVMGELTKEMMKEKEGTHRTELEIAGAKALRGMMESGMFGRQDSEQKHAMKFLNRGDFLEGRKFRDISSYFQSPSGQDYADEGIDIAERIDAILDAKRQSQQEVQRPVENRPQQEWGAGGEVGSRKKSIFDYAW
jgi:hypothetical protein